MHQFVISPRYGWHTACYGPELMLPEVRRDDRRTTLQAIAARVTALAARIGSLGMRRAADDLTAIAAKLTELADEGHGPTPSATMTARR